MIAEWRTFTKGIICVVPQRQMIRLKGFWITDWLWHQWENVQGPDGVLVAVSTGGAVGFEVAVGSGIAVSVGGGTGVSVGVGTGVSVGTGVNVSVGTCVSVSVGMGVSVFVGVNVGIFVGLNVGVFVGPDACTALDVLPNTNKVGDEKVVGVLDAETVTVDW